MRHLRGTAGADADEVETKMSDLRQAAQLALEAWDNAVLLAHDDLVQDRMDSLRTELEQQAEPVLQTCNCRWDGDVQVQQCTLHEAHVDAIHEWAERAKVAERKLAQQAEPVSLMNALNFFTESERMALWKRGNYSDSAIANITQAVLNKIRTAPPQRKPLSDEQIDDIWVEHGCEGEDAYGFARAIEAAHHIQEPKS